MRKFLIRWLIFLFPIVVMAVGIEYALRRMPNNYKTKAEGFSNASDVEILILGSSHAFYGVDPTKFDKPALNGAQPSQTYEVDAAIFEHYSESFASLKYLFVPVSYFSFQLTFEHVADPWRAKNYWLYYDLDLSNNPMYRFEITSLPLKKNIERLRDYYQRHISEVTVDSHGYLLSEPVEGVDLEELGKVASARHERSINAEDSVQCLKAIEQLIKDAGSKNVKVILFTPPYYKSYIAGLDPVKLAAVKATANEMAKNFSNVSYYDFMTDSSFTTSDFRDADHLNKQGSAKLTMKLNQIK